MKITVKSTNRDLVFFPDTKIRVQENNPMFHELGSYSFPFDIPLEENNRALNYPARLTKSGLPKFEVEVLVESKNFDDNYGILLVTPSTSSLSVSLILGHGRFHYKLKNANLRDILDEVISLDADTYELFEETYMHATNCISQSWPAVPYNFPSISAPDFYSEDDMPNYEGVINHYAGSSGFEHFYPFTQPLVPLLYLSEILKRIIDNFELKHNNDVLYHSIISKILVWNNTPLNSFVPFYVNLEQSSILSFHDTSSIDVLLPVVNIDEYDTISASKFYPKHAGTYKFKIDFQYTEAININHFRIGLYNNNSFIAWFTGSNGHLLQDTDTSSEMSVTISEIDLAGDPAYHLKAITYENMPPAGGYEPTTVFNTLELALRIYPETYIHKVDKELNLKNHVPNITASQLWNAFSDIFGFRTIQNGDKLEMFFLKDIVSKAYKSDLSEYMLKNFEISSPEKISALKFSSDTQPIDDFTLEHTVNSRWMLPSTFHDNKLAYVRDELSYFLSKYDENYNASWSYYSENQYGIDVTDEGSEISPEFSPLKTVREIINPAYPTPDDPNRLQYNRLIIKSNDQAYVPELEMFNEPSLAFCYWLGNLLVDDDPPGPLDNIYAPTGSTANRNNWSNEITGLVNLTFNGDNNLFTEFWHDFVEFKNNACQLIADMSLTPTQLRSLKFTERYTAQGIGFIISKKDYEFDIATDEIKQPVTLTLAVKK